MDKTYNTRLEPFVLPTDRIGKVFAVVDQEMLLCLICEAVFWRFAARKHAKVPCRPILQQKSRDFARHLVFVSCASDGDKMG